LLDKVVLITGAARGTAKATAERFHAEAAIVTVTDINAPGGEAVASQFSERAEYHHLDVSQEDDWKQVFQIIEQTYGRLDVLVICRTKK